MTRAFTLVELMIVVILIGILTVMAIPTMAEARYNARTFDDATQIAELYRDGRARAMGRGAAMLLQMTSANSIGGANLGTFTLYEAQVGGLLAGGTSTLPLPGGSPLGTCSGPVTNWTTIIANGTATAATSGTLIDMVSLNKGAEQTAQIWTVLNDGAGSPTGGSLCYTPLGRAYYQRSLAPVFTPGANLLHGELQIAVQRSGISTGAATGLTRTVIIPDSGSTRIVSR